MAEEREKIIESELKGVTLRVYWHILGSKKQVVGVRPVQRALGLSSPSVKVGVLQNFVGVLGFMLPRYLFYSTMFTVMLALYPIIYRPDLSTHNIMAFVFGLSAVAVSWSETWRAWKLRPF